MLGAEEGKLFLAIEFDVMKRTNNAKRSRGRGDGKKHSSNRSHNYESASPEGKLRGSPQQILDKYLVLAREAQTTGDRIACEGYHQHAEHFYRVINADGNRQRNNQGERNQNQRGQGSQPQAQQPESPQPQAEGKQPQQELQSEEQSSNQQEPKQQEAERTRTRTRKPKVKPAEVKKIDIVAEKPQTEIAPAQVAEEEKPEAAAS